MFQPQRMMEKMSMSKGLVKRILSIFLSATIIASSISGCNKSVIEDTNDNAASVDTTKIVEEATKAILEEIDNTEDNNEQPTTEEVLETSVDAGLSLNWEDYIGDFETFVYGLLVNELKYKYDVFSAYVKLEDGISVYGIGYTDYSECYTNEDESKAVFKAGLIPYYGETDIPDEEFNNGLQLFDVEFQEDSTNFVLAYESNEFTEHCVVYEKYLKYGVDSKGHVYYETQDYDKDRCDESLGALYSFDEEKYLYDTDFGNYIPISGTSLSEEIDYEELERAINEILDKQDFDFTSIEIQTYAYIAQEAIQSYLLSVQQETFLGYDVKELVRLAGEIDPTECYRITSDGLLVVDIDEDVGNEASSLVKWLVGTGCVIVTAVGIVGAMVFIECPPLSAAAGAMAGIGIEIFMQVVISGRALDSVEWNRVALAAATGAVSGFLGPYVMAQFEGVAYFCVDSAIDGVLGGMEKAVAAWLDGESGKEIIKEFGYGVALGLGLSAGFKGVGKILEKGASKLGAIVVKSGEKVFPNLSKKVSELFKTLGKSKAAKAINGFSDLIYNAKEVADSTVFHSKYISDKIAWRQIDRILDEGSDELVTKAFREIKKNNELLDVNENVISRDTLKQLFDNAADGDVIGKIKVNDEVVEIIKKNGIVSVAFDSSKYQTVTLPGRMVADRNKNMEDAAEIYKKMWLDDPSSMPESIKKILDDKKYKLEELMPNDLVNNVIKKSDMVMHENADLRTITLVSRKVHDFMQGGVFHMGGYGLANHLKEHMGAEFFDRFMSAASSAFSEGG